MNTPKECQNCSALIEESDFFWVTANRDKFLCVECMEELEVGPYYKARLSERLGGTYFDKLLRGVF